MNILTIGILAHNEEEVIDSTISSLFGQSIFDASVARSLGIDQISVIVAPNGCSDNTAEVAAAALKREVRPLTQATVQVLKEPGKSRSWNTLVHELAPAETRFFVFLDADIEIGSPTVVEQLLKGLQDWPETLITTSEPVKRFIRPRRLSLQQAFSRRASAQASSPHAIAGSLYCARAEVLRQIWLPVATPGEDGFLCAVVKTDGFTRPPIEDTVRRVPGTCHFYVPDEGLSGFIRHESRLLVGSSVNIFMFEYFWEQKRSTHVGPWIAEQNRLRPDWVDQLVADRTRGRRWRLPTNLLFMRLHPLRDRPLREAILRAPVALAATLISIVPNIRANRILAGRRATRFW